MHAAFATPLLDAKEHFAISGDIDWGALRERKSATKARVRRVRLGEGALRDYQETGVQWMHALASWAPGCVLADDMGLGKTV